jgi:hypothetical protein
LAAAEARDTVGTLASGWATRRLLVALVAARAGLADSARAIAMRVRRDSLSRTQRDAVDFGEAAVRAALGEQDAATRLLAEYLERRPTQRRLVARHPWFASLTPYAPFTTLVTRTATRESGRVAPRP